MKKAIIEQEKTHRETIDRACRKFARTKTWPPLSGEEMLWLFPRMKQSLDLLQFLRIGGRSNTAARTIGLPVPHDLPPQFSEADALEYLLVDYWHHIGCDRQLASQTLHL